jgi:hypothetical protein
VAVDIQPMVQMAVLESLLLDMLTHFQPQHLQLVRQL